MNRRAFARLPWSLAAVLAMAVVALGVHLPGHLSVDSVISLYEARTGQAYSWTPTFQSALLAWAGGGLRAAGLHVVAMVVATVGAWMLLWPTKEGARAQRWVALLIALNPLIWMMVGVLWRDVLLGTAMLVATAALMRLRRGATLFGGASLALHASIVVALSVAALARPQGMLLAAAGAVAYAVIVVRRSTLEYTPRSMSATAALLMAMPLLVAALVIATRMTIRPLPPSTPTMDGVGLVMAYDIAGTLARSKRLGTASVPTLDDALRKQMVAAYDPMRVDPLQAVPGFREWIIRERAAGLWPAWHAVVVADPLAYLRHRAAAAGALLGTGDVRRCLPGYWGVAGLPDMLEALDIREAMDERDLWLGRQAVVLAATPWFWNATYLMLLLGLAPTLIRARRTDPVPFLLFLGATAFTLAYLLTTVACDVRYLYPLVTVASALALDRLNGPSRKAGFGGFADLR